jgi:hypothetical protein
VGRLAQSRYSLSRVAPQQLAPLAGTGAELVVPDAAAENEQAVWERMVAEALRLQAEELTDPEGAGEPRRGNTKKSRL